MAAIDVKLARGTDEEILQLRRYLAPLLGRLLDDALLREAERRADEIPRYRATTCARRVDARGGVLACTVRRASVLRAIRVEGLPAALLESDLRKRLLFTPGDPLEDEDEATKKGERRTDRQVARIVDYLEREGYYGARVRLRRPATDVPGVRDLVVDISGGSFVRVQRVALARFGPLSQKDLLDDFGHMCLTTSGFLDLVTAGVEPACFNARRLEETVRRFTEQLHARGYPEADVRVTPTLIDPTKTAVPACAASAFDVAALSKRGQRPAPRCVELLVDVNAGRQLTARFWAAPGERPVAVWPDLFDTFRDFAETGARVVEGLQASPLIADALDTELDRTSLRKQLSFEEARSLDESEVAVTAERIEAYLASRGHLSPHVRVERVDYDDAVVLDFFIEKSPIGAVRSVHIDGLHALTEEEVVEKAELATSKRSYNNAGTVSELQLADDEARILELLAGEGFPEADVHAEALLRPDGAVDVVFHVDEGTRFILRGVQVDGGDPVLLPEVLGVLRHCSGGLATRQQRKPRIPEDCAGAPLIPGELEADAQRVLNVYAAHGYPQVETTAEAAFSADGTRVRISILPKDASAAERAAPHTGNVTPLALGEVFVDGANTTSRGVILRELGVTNEDDLVRLDPVRLGKGVSRLRRTGLFSSVRLGYLGVNDTGDVAHVRLTLEEKPAFTLDSSVGFSSEQLFSLRGELRHRNLLGSMLDTSALLDFGLFIGRFSQTKLQVRWPRILGTDLSVTATPLSVSYADEPTGARLKTPASPGAQHAATAWAAPDERRRLFSAGGSLSLDWRATDLSPLVDEKLTLGLGFELRSDWLDLAGAPVAPLSLGAWNTVDGLLPTLFPDDADLPAAQRRRPTQVATLTPRISFADIDNPFDPHTGYAVDVFVRVSRSPLYDPDIALGGDSYGVVGFAGRVYVSPLDRLTFAFGSKARLGVAPLTSRCAGAAGCEWALMQNDLLVLGGERSVRGVDENQIGVLGPIYDPQLKPVLNDDGTQKVQLRPGLFGAFVNVEARYTLLRNFLIGDVKPAVFADLGVSTDSPDLRLLPAADAQTDLRWAASVGVGLRYVLVVGPLSVDVAYAPSRNTWHGYLTFGYIF